MARGLIFYNNFIIYTLYLMKINNFNEKFNVHGTLRMMLSCKYIFNMNPSDLKKKLSKLWKDTFHDSDDYISLVFNNYFDPELAEYEEVGGDIVAGLIGIPYNFGNSERSIRGLYLCGLATKPQYRSRGLMTRMLARINEKARIHGYVFTFLIPSDEGLRKYYRDRDYVNAFYRVIDNYTSLHDFKLEYENILLEQKEKVIDLKRHYFESLKAAVLDPAADNVQTVREGIETLITSIEFEQQDLQILHSDKDIRLIIDENILSGGHIHYVTNNSGKITSVAFTRKADGAIEILKLYSSDEASKYTVLDSVKTMNADLAIRHYIPSIAMDRKALWQRTYGSFMKDAPQVGAVSITERVYSLAAHAKVYGMARILDFPEILKFQAAIRHDLKYSILVKGDDTAVFEHIDVRNGKVNIKSIPAESLSPSQIAYVMSKRDIGEILFRRRDTDNLITEAFGIPSINGAICLMLD